MRSCPLPRFTYDVPEWLCCLLDAAVYEAYKATDGADPDTTAFEQAFVTSLIEQTPMESVAECLDPDTAATLARALNRRAARSARMGGRVRVREVGLQHRPQIHDPELDALLYGDPLLSDAV